MRILGLREEAGKAGPTPILGIHLMFLNAGLEETPAWMAAPEDSAITFKKKGQQGFGDKTVITVWKAAAIPMQRCTAQSHQ